MRSKQTDHLRSLVKGKPIHINWRKATRAELESVRALWEQRIIECVKVDNETMTATFTKREGK